MPSGLVRELPSIKNQVSRKVVFGHGIKSKGDWRMNAKKVIIDCDPGIDDALALMLALRSPELEILGITVVSGNVPAKKGAANAQKVLHWMNQPDIPVYLGEELPLVRPYVDAMDTHGEDGLGESHYPEITDGTINTDGVGFLARTLHEAAQKEEPVSIIALGPLTNLARLVQNDPESLAGLGELISMGGSCQSHGNCSPVAEYNYWCDPEAAAVCFEAFGAAGKKIHMVGLDVTRKIVLTPNLLEYMKRLNPETGQFVQAITKFYFDFHWEWEHLIGCVINDPLAVAWFADPSLCSGFEAYMAVETGGISMGQTVVDSMGFYRREANALILTQTDAVRFFRMFFSRILGMEEDKLDLLDSLVEGK